MNLTLKQLETFVWVADLGSFRGAAERLCTTQPNVSSRISVLEATLGTVLMERDAGSVRLTAKGISLLEHARRVLAEVDHFIDAADAEELYGGVLRLGVTEMVVQTWLRDFLKLYKQAFPKVVIELTVDLSANLEYELAEKSIDLAFQSGPFTQSASGQMALGTFPIIWVAAPQLGFVPGQRITLKDIAQFPVLTHAKNTRTYLDLMSHFAAHPDQKMRVVPSSSLTACTQMTVDGYGVAALLAPIVMSELQSGQLLELRYPWSPSSLDFFARYDAHRASAVIGKAADIAAQVSSDFSAAFKEQRSQR